MLKTRLLLLALALCLFFLPAGAENRYPACQGAVTDLAGVLSPDTAGDAAALSQRLDAAAGGKIYLVTRHFLGGTDAREYAKELFACWELGEMDALLLMVIGEEDYALVLGERAGALLPREMQMTLLSASFRTAFLSRDYDGAAGEMLLALSGQMARAAGEKLDTAGLFGQTALQATPQPAAWKDIWSGMFAQVEEEEETAWAQQQTQEETKINWRTIIIWGLVIYFLFFRKKKRARRFNFGRPPKGRR